MVQSSAVCYPAIILMAKAAAPDRSEFLTSGEVIGRLLDHPELRRVSATCVLPAVRVGGEWMFRRTDLETWIAHHHRAGRAASDRPSAAAGGA